MSNIAELDCSKVVDIDFRSDEFKRNAHRHVASWARRPPFYVLNNGPPQVVVGRYADVLEVFSDAERFASELPKGPGFEQFDKFMGIPFVTQMDGERHARLRRLLMPAFSSRRMAQIEASIAAIIEKMLDDIERTGPAFDAMNQYGAKLVVNVLVASMMGLDDSEQQILLDYQEVLSVVTALRPGEPYPPACRRAFDRATDLAHKVIADRRAHPRSDFLSDLVLARDQGDRLSDDELFGTIFGMFGAIAATSRSAGGTLYTLYSHPDQLALLIEDPDLIPDAIEECLRIASNGYFTFARIATRDTLVGGTDILKGMVVRPSPLAANYDPEVFPDPLRFDVRRKPKRIMSFAAGPHHCIGNILGRTSITIAIRRLLARFPHARLADPNFVPVYGGSVGELRLQSLPMLIE